MPRIPLLGGAYQAKSVIANAQRCINLYPETNPESSQAPVPVTHYGTPGLTRLLTAPSPLTWRCLYRATNNEGFGVCGDKVYLIEQDWTLTELGTIGAGTTPVIMSDNSIDIVIVDGSINGYTVNLTTHAFSQISDPAFYGSARADYLDTFFLFNRPDTNQFYTSLSNSVSFDALDIAAKTGGADFIQAVIVKSSEAWPIGLYTSEVWGLVGGADFPLARVPSSIIDHGCVAKYSIAKADVSVFWLTQDDQGQCIVIQTKGYRAERISTYALEVEFQTYAKVSDAIGYTYQQGGHLFYVLIFPQADKTWVYDVSTQQWHQWAWVDNNGKLHRHRSNCYAFIYGKNVVGDYANGKLYQLDPNAYLDDGQPIVRVRTFPHLIENGNRVTYRSFIADVDAGNILQHMTEDSDRSDFNWDFNSDFGASPPIAAVPMLTLRWSDTRGHSWGTPVNQRLGSTGQYIQSPKWAPLGMARDRVFELSWAVNAPVALNGAFIETVSHRT